MNSTLFQSFFIGGFECSAHRSCSDGKHLDLISSTKHDKFVYKDYKRLHEMGMKTARDGVRWHLIEKSNGYYDWNSVLPMFNAARETNTQVIWDLLHFGWLDDIDIFKPIFIDRFARFAKAFIKLHLNESDVIPFVAPLNEPSFLSFACGEKGFFYPYAKNRGDEIKDQLVRAIIAACEAIWDVCPEARIVHTDPIINIIAEPSKPQDRMPAEMYRQAQFIAWDMIAGKSSPHLGGHIKYLDIIGVNYYINNQWVHNVGLLTPSHPHHLPLRFMLREVYERYLRPLFIAETGIEADVRPQWFQYIGREVRAALKMKIPIEGICIYPIINHPGWNDERNCPNGLWSYANEIGEREIYEPLAVELQRQQRLLLEMDLNDSSVQGFNNISQNGLIENFEHIDWNVMDAAAHDIEALTARSRE